MRNRLNRIEKCRIWDNPMRAAKVSVTKRGQTTIPAEFRKRCGIEEGSILEIEDTGGGFC
jgi:AbrB family looped-hinge helix DNA binding protein